MNNGGIRWSGQEYSFVQLFSTVKVVVIQLKVEVASDDVAPSAL